MAGGPVWLPGTSCGRQCAGVLCVLGTDGRTALVVGTGHAVSRGMSTHTLHFQPRQARAQRTRLARLGDMMARHRGRIALLQWAIVGLYFVLVAVPAFLPMPPEDARMFNSLTRFAQFAFWGIWWPFVIASMLLVGRFWCGVMCPEGALTEFAGRPGKGRPIPRWMRWPGWPLVG